jgi:hypothetical protein
MEGESYTITILHVDVFIHDEANAANQGIGHPLMQSHATEDAPQGNAYTGNDKLVFFD